MDRVGFSGLLAIDPGLLDTLATLCIGGRTGGCAGIEEGDDSRNGGCGLGEEAVKRSARVVDVVANSERAGETGIGPCCGD